jgi:hypothetical protein
MCKSLAEGGMRCAAHTRPAFTRSLNSAVANPHDVDTISNLENAAIAYAATPTGQKAVMAEARAQGNAGQMELASLLHAAAVRGEADYQASKEATRIIEQEERRSEALAWATRVPEDPRAWAQYERLVMQDLNVDETTLAMLASAEQARTAQPATGGDIADSRFIITLDGENYIGTSMDPTVTRTIAGLEKLAAETRLAQRSRIETTDIDGRTWVRYENNTLSEVLQSVSYHSETKTLDVSLFNHRDRGLPGSRYTYHGVTPSVVKALTSARSMGRFYSMVFSGLSNGGDLGGAKAKDFSFAVAAANFMAPVGDAKGPVPRNYRPARLDAGEIVTI